MTVPSVVSMIGSNKQLLGIQALGLSAPDEAVFKANFAAAYQQTINDCTSAGATNPFLADVLRAELIALAGVAGSPPLTDTQLAALPVRGP